MADVIGYVAGVFIMVSFIPQVMRSYRTRSVTDLSFTMIVTTLLGTAGWITYGIMVGAPPVVVMNAIFGVFVVMLLVLKVRHD